MADKDIWVINAVTNLIRAIFFETFKEPTSSIIFLGLQSSSN